MRRNVLAAFALGAALVLGISAPALADDAPQVKKTLETNEGSTVAAEFEFEAQAVQLSTEVDGVSTEAVADCPSVTIESISLAAGTTEGEADITFGTFPHAGVYAWTISEKAGDTTVDGGEMQYDDQVYTLIATVKNPAEDGGDYVVSYVIVKGEATSTVNEESKKAAEVEFTNKYTETADLTVKKTISGATANMDETFDFTVTFDASGVTVLPSDAETAADVLGQIEATAPDGVTVTWNDDHSVATFTIGHKDEVTFSGIVTGVTYTVEEETPADYTASGEVTTATTLTEDDAEVEVVNTSKDITVTGLILNNAPFIVLGAVAIAGVVLYGAAKRKLQA